MALADLIPLIASAAAGYVLGSLGGDKSAPAKLPTRQVPPELTERTRLHGQLMELQDAVAELAARRVEEEHALEKLDFECGMRKSELDDLADEIAQKQALKRALDNF